MEKKPLGEDVNNGRNTIELKNLHKYFGKNEVLKGLI